MKPTWLNDFKQQLAAEQIKCQKQVKPLYLMRTYQPLDQSAANPADYYQDPYHDIFTAYGQKVMVQGTKNITYLFDFAKYAAAKTTKYQPYTAEVYCNTPEIDSLLVNFTQYADTKQKRMHGMYYNNALVISNKFLKEQHAPYRVVVLNAIEDFILNDYLKIDFNTHRKTDSFAEQFYDTFYTSMQGYIQSIKINQKFHEQYIKPVLECLLFLDQNNCCFLALPADNFYFEQSSKQLPVLKASVSQIQKLIAQFPVAKIRDFYPALISRMTYSETGKRGRFDNYLACYDSLTFNYFDSQLKTTNQFDLHFRRKRYLKYFEYDICTAHTHALEHYFKEHLHVNCDYKGDIVNSITPSNKAWQEHFRDYQTNHFPYMINNYATADHPTKQANCELWDLYLKDNDLPTVLNTKAFKQPLLKATAITDLPLTTNKPALKPLVDKQMGQVLAKLQTGNSHQYYYLDHKLYTLTGNTQIDHAEELNLNDQNN